MYITTGNYIKLLPEHSEKDSNGPSTFVKTIQRALTMLQVGLNVNWKSSLMPLEKGIVSILGSGSRDGSWHLTKNCVVHV